MNDQTPLTEMLARAAKTELNEPRAAAPEPEHEEPREPPLSPEDQAAVDQASRAINDAVERDAAKLRNDYLDRSAAAHSAVEVVMAQCGLAHPTRKSRRTYHEIERLLHELHGDPGGEIRLGDQFMGEGFK